MRETASYREPHFATASRNAKSEVQNYWHRKIILGELIRARARSVVLAFGTSGSSHQGRDISRDMPTFPGTAAHWFRKIALPTPVIRAKWQWPSRLIASPDSIDPPDFAPRLRVSTLHQEREHGCRPRGDKSFKS